MHYAFGDRVIAVDYAVAPGLRFRERNRELGLPPRTMTWADEKVWLRKKLQTRCDYDEREKNIFIFNNYLYLKRCRY